jgi:hypothetical protein
VENDMYKIGRKTKIRWENDIKEDIRIMKINNSTKCIQKRDKWEEVFEKIETFRQ